MSITMSVGAKGATTGRKDETIPGDGKIDTREEAEAALTYVKGGKTATVGGDTYTEDDLVNIRDGGAATGGEVQGEGVSHGAALELHGTSDSGDLGHGDFGLGLSYRLGIPVAKGDGFRAYLDGIAGFDFSGADRDFKTPGGEPYTSSFTSASGVIGADLRMAPPIWDHRLWIALGARGSVGKFGTEEGEEVSIPPTCVPGDFGRGECDPGAGPTKGNAGTKGLHDPRVGNARETSGVVLGIDVPLTLGVTVLRGRWGSLDVFGGPKWTYRDLSPKDGQGFDYTALGGFFGVAGRFGGADSYVPVAGAVQSKDSDGDGVPDSQDKCPGTKVGEKVDATGCPLPKPVADKDKDGVPDDKDKCPDTKAGLKVDAKGCPEFDGAVTSVPESVIPGGKLPVGVKVGQKSDVTLQFKDASGKVTNAKPASVDAGESTSEFDVPTSLVSGKYKVVITLKDPKTGVEKVEEKDVVIVERITATLPGSFAPGQPPAIQDVKVVGQPKLEGVSYVIQAIDKAGKPVGELPVTDKPGTIQDVKGTRIGLKAPTAKGWQRDTTYTVTLKNKEGHVIWIGSFEIGQAAAGKGGRRRL